MLVLLVTGCSASTSPTGVTTTDGSMVAMVDGYSWSSTVIPPGISGGASAKRSDAGALTLTGVSTNHGSIILVLLHPKIGMDTLGLGNSGSYIDDGKQVYITAGVNKGLVSLTTYDSIHHLVSGTFNFQASRTDSVSTPATVTVTNGSFYNLEWGKN
ncbi:MAG: DUF6252 family protein [Bacteroidota bacterium]|nr:DUF6252 family protein [Bacteroidota bacterium]